MKFSRKNVTLLGFMFLQLLAFGQSKPKMNVVLVVIDDLGPAWIPPYAKKLNPNEMEQAAIDAYSKQQKQNVDIQKHLEAAKRSMPFLDSLSNLGVIFDHAFATSSICAPSRAGILTSKYQERWGGYNLEDMAATGIPLNEVLMPSLFKKNGYASAVIGKWHVGLEDESTKNNPEIDDRHKRSSCEPAYNPINRGFDYYFGYNSSESRYFGSDDLWENTTPVATKPLTEFLTETLSDKANGFIEKSLTEKKPFFVYFAPMTIHGMLAAPPVKYTKQFDTGIEFSNRVAGHLLALDEGIRKIYSTLKKYKQDKNTLIIVCADNGPSNPVMPYSAPYKGGKGSGWIGGSRVPLLMILPGTTAKLTIDKNVSNLDIMPTALDLAGIPVPKGIDGVSLRKYIIDKDVNYIAHDYLFSSGSQAITWSVNYLDGKTPSGLNDLKDRRFCPNFLWGLNGENVFLNVSPIKKAVYPSLPDGLPEQKFFFQLSSDPKQYNSIYNVSDKTQAILEDKTIDWLKNNKEPAKYNKEGYKILTQK